MNSSQQPKIRELAKGIEDGDSTINEDDTNTETEESPIHADDVGEPSKQDIDDATDGQHKTQSEAVTKGLKYECQQCDKAYTTRPKVIIGPLDQFKPLKFQNLR